MKPGDYVLPRRKILDGRGCVWEYELAARGWNELPAEKKPGVLLENWIVRFEAVDIDAVVFPDEIVMCGGLTG